MPGANSTLRLTIKGEVWQPVQVTPRSAAFGRITAASAEAGQQRKLTIVNNVGGELKLTDVQSSNPQFAAEIKPIEDGKQYELTVTLVPPLAQGNNTGKITMKTGLDEPAVFEVPAYVFVTLPVDVSPTQLVIMPNQTAELKRQFYIRSNDGKGFEIQNLRSTNPALALELQDVQGNQQTYRLSVTVPAKFVPAETGDKITLETSHPAVPKLEIPVTATAASRVQRAQRAAPRGTFTGRIATPPAGRSKPATAADGPQKPAAADGQTGKPAAEPSAETKPGE